MMGEGLHRKVGGGATTEGEGSRRGDGERCQKRARGNRRQRKVEGRALEHGEGQKNQESERNVRGE